MPAANSTNEVSAWFKRLERALAAPPAIHDVQTISVGDIWGQHFHTTVTHELIHVLAGRARIEFRQRFFLVGPGDTFVIPQGLPHRDIRSEGSDYRVMYVFFQWPAGRAALRAADPQALLQTPEGLKPHLHFLMKQLESEHLSDAAGAPERMRVILLEVLLALLRNAHGSGSSLPQARRVLARSRRTRLATEARALLEQDCAQSISLEGLATKFGVSPFHLSRSFSQEFGISITEMLTLIRIERATELLKGGGHSVKEIAAAVGFSDSNYFAKVFRRSRGISPTEYQARLR